MLKNEPGTYNAKINKTKSLSSSNLRPHEKKADMYLNNCNNTLWQVLSLRKTLERVLTFTWLLGAEDGRSEKDSKCI